MKKQILIIFIALVFPLVSFANPIAVGGLYVVQKYPGEDGSIQFRSNLHNQCQQWKLALDDPDRSNYATYCGQIERIYNLELKINELDARITELESNQTSILGRLNALDISINNGLKSIILMLIGKK